MNVQELFTPVALAANSTTVIATTGNPAILGGFLCTTAGTLNITDGAGADVVAAFAVTLGQFVPLPFALGNGCRVVLSGGCAGTLGTGR